MARIAQSNEQTIQEYYDLVDSTIVKYKIGAKQLWNADEIRVVHVESKVKFVTKKDEIRRQQVRFQIL
jgi:hypothetical protein